MGTQGKCVTPMSSEPTPCISVIMGVRYVGRDITLLRRSVESVRDQTYSDFEFLICDDGSTEEAKRYLEQVADSDSRVRLVRRDGCLDLARKLNLCLGYSQGRFIARMDDDDRSYPDRLEKEMNFLLSHPDAAFVGCNVNLIQSGRKIGERHLPEFPTIEDFFFAQPYVHPTLVFRREPLLAVGGYSEEKDCVRCEDYDLLLRLYEIGSFGINLQEALLDYTVPKDLKGKRRMSHCLNEMKTRYRRFRALGKLPKALPYVIKPVVVGILPAGILAYMKKKRMKGVVWEDGDCEKPCG